MSYSFYACLPRDCACSHKLFLFTANRRSINFIAGSSIDTLSRSLAVCRQTLICRAKVGLGCLQDYFLSHEPNPILFTICHSRRFARNQLRACFLFTHKRVFYSSLAHEFTRFCLLSPFAFIPLSREPPCISSRLLEEELHRFGFATVVATLLLLPPSRSHAKPVKSDYFFL